MKTIVAVAGLVLVAGSSAWAQKQVAPELNLVPDAVGQATSETLYTKLTAKETGGLYSVSEVYFGAGFDVVPHKHESSAETFLLLEGRFEVRYEVDGEPVDVVMTPGSMLHIPPGSAHSMYTRGSGFLILIFAPGGIEEYGPLYDTLTPEELEDEEFMVEFRRKNNIDWHSAKGLGYPFDLKKEE